MPCSARPKGERRITVEQRENADEQREHDVVEMQIVGEVERRQKPMSGRASMYMPSDPPAMRVSWKK